MSLAKKLESLLNPAPVFEDPQDLDFDVNKPQLVEFNDDLDDEPISSGSNLRRINDVELSQIDERYLGKKVSRKNINNFDDDEHEESDEDYDTSNVSEKSDNSCDEGSEDGSDSQIDGNDSESEEEMDENDELNDGDFNDQENDELMEDDVQDGDQTMRTFTNSNAEENIEKGVAVQSQLKLWDSLLECRIKLQKVLLAANQLPQHNVWQDFWTTDSDSISVLKNSQKQIESLLDTFIHFQSVLQKSNEEVNQLITPELTESDSENKIEVTDNKESITDRGLKRKLKFDDYPNYLKKLHSDFESPRNQIIQKWDDKTKVSAGRLSKSFSSFDQSALQQIQQILNDRDRLINRTRLKRSTFQVLGKKYEKVENDDDNVSYESVLKQDSHLKDYDAEIYDDNDFYHQLLRELIEHKTTDINDINVLGRQWLEIQKLRSKMKKKVDTRASKGRKLRFDVHPKLASFMAPQLMCTISDEARKELFGSLFGNLTPLNNHNVELHG